MEKNPAASNKGTRTSTHKYQTSKEKTLAILEGDKGKVERKEMK